MGIVGERWSFFLLSVRLFLVVLARLHTGDTGEFQLGFYHVLRHTGYRLHPLVASRKVHLSAAQCI